jgi:hypothetical protein
VENLLNRLRHVNIPGYQCGDDDKKLYSEISLQNSSYSDETVEAIATQLATLYFHQTTSISGIRLPLSFVFMLDAAQREELRRSVIAHYGEQHEMISPPGAKKNTRKRTGKKRKKGKC